MIGHRETGELPLGVGLTVWASSLAWTPAAWLRNPVDCFVVRALLHVWCRDVTNSTRGVVSFLLSFSSVRWL